MQNMPHVLEDTAFVVYSVTRLIMLSPADGAKEFSGWLIENLDMSAAELGLYACLLPRPGSCLESRGRKLV